MAQFSPAFANAGVVSIVTSAADAATGSAITAGWYLVIISNGGAGTSLNMGAAATVAMPTLTPGTYGPWFLSPAGADSKLHAIALSAGRVDLVPVTSLGAP